MGEGTLGAVRPRVGRKDFAATRESGFGMDAATRSRSSDVLALVIVLTLLGAFITEMGLSILLQNLACNCIVEGTPRWAWVGAPIAIMTAGMTVVECAVLVAMFPGLRLGRKVVIAVVAAGAIEAAAVLGTSQALTLYPNREVLFPVTVGVVVLLPAVLVALWVLDAPVRAATRRPPSERTLLTAGEGISGAETRRRIRDIGTVLWVLGLLPLVTGILVGLVPCGENLGSCAVTACGPYPICDPSILLFGIAFGALGIDMLVFGLMMTRWAETR